MLNFMEGRWLFVAAASMKPSEPPALGSLLVRRAGSQEGKLDILGEE